MPSFFVEHNIPNAGELTPPELKAITQQCLDVLHPQMEWVHGTITADKIYCLYVAHDEKMVRDHARRCGLPIQEISRVSAIIDPLAVAKID